MSPHRARFCRPMLYAVLLCMLAPASARADHDLGAEMAGKIALALYGELLIPDLRLELPQSSPESPSLVLTEPLHFAIPLSKEIPVELAVLVEPQYQVRDHVWRVVAGARVDVPQPDRVHNLFGELLAVAGEDGSGAAIGVGYTLLESLFPMASIGYRLTWVSQGGLRHDLTLDLVTSKLPL